MPGFTNEELMDACRETGGTVHPYQDWPLRWGEDALADWSSFGPVIYVCGPVPEAFLARFRNREHVEIHKRSADGPHFSEGA